MIRELITMWLIELALFVAPKELELALAKALLLGMQDMLKSKNESIKRMYFGNTR